MKLIYGLLFSLAFAATSQSSPLKIVEKHPAGKTNTILLSETSLRLNDHETAWEKTDFEHYRKILTEDAALKAIKSDEYCLPNERMELTTSGKPQVFCKNKKAMDRINEVISDLKIVSTPT